MEAVTIVRVGVIGLGAMGVNHVRVYSQLGVEVAGIVDVDASRGRPLAAKYHTSYHSNSDALLADPRVDAVSIATPTSTHAEIATRALLAGKHVLLEKPITDTTAAGEKLIELAKQQGLVLAVGHIERHNPVVGLAKEMLSQGDAGEILSVASRRVGGMNTRIMDVGVILDLAIHDIDIACFLVDDVVESVFAATGPRGGREDRAHVLLEFTRGPYAAIEANWRSPMKVRRLAVTCAASHLELDYIAQSIDRSRSQVLDASATNLYAVPREYESHKLAVRNQEPLANELKDFLAAIGDRRAPLVTGEHGLRALRIALAAVTSARERRRIDLTETSP